MSSTSTSSRLLVLLGEKESGQIGQKSSSSSSSMQQQQRDLICSSLMIYMNHVSCFFFRANSKGHKYKHYQKPYQVINTYQMSTSNDL